MGQAQTMLGTSIRFTRWGREHIGRVVSVRAFTWMEPEEFEFIVEVLGHRENQKYTVRSYELADRPWV